MGLLGFGIKSILKLIIPLAIVGGLLFYFGQGLQNASLEKFDLTGIKDVNPESFTVAGNVYIKNPSDLSIPIESIDYVIYLKETGEEIGAGTLPQFTLEKNNVNKIPFNQQVTWIPTAKLAAELITKDKVLIEVKGKLRINIPTVREYAIPFSQETDIKAYIQQFVTSPIKQPLPITDQPIPVLPAEDKTTDENPEKPLTVIPLPVLN